MKQLTKIFMVIMSLVCLVMLCSSIVFSTNVFYQSSKFISISLFFVILLIWFFFYKKIASRIVSLDSSKKKICFGIYFFCFFLIQYFLFQELKVNPTWDFGVLYNNALSYVRHEAIGYIEYFEYCPNNILIYLFYILVLKVSQFIPGIGALNLLGILNILFIELSCYFTYLIAKKIYNERIAVTVLFVLLFLSPLFLYNPIIYTDTTTLFIPVFLIYLFLREQEAEGKAKFFYLVLFAFMAYVGYKLKMSCFIMVIALLLHFFLNSKWKDLGKYFVTLGIVFISCTFLFQAFILNNSKFHFQDNGVGNLPFTHYVMMGLEDNSRDYPNRMTYGGYVEEDVNFTKSIPSDQRASKNIEEIKRRLSTYTPFEYIQYLGKKIANTWGDGTYFAPIKLSRSPLKTSYLHEFVLPSGSYFNVYLNISQAIQFALLFLLLISVWLQRNDRSKTYLYTSIFGLFLFLLIWETRSRYIVNYIPIFVLALLGTFQHIFRES